MPRIPRRFRVQYLMLDAETPLRDTLGDPVVEYVEVEYTTKHGAVFKQFSKSEAVKRFGTGCLVSPPLRPL